MRDRSIHTLMPIFRKHVSLRACLGAALGALILLLALALAGVLGEMAKREVARLATANLENLSQQMARELSAGMDGFARDAQTQANREIYRNPALSREEARAALDQFIASHAEYAYMALVDAASAKVFAASGGIFEGGSAAGRPMFEEGKKAPFVGDVHDAGRLAELLPKPLNGEPLRFLDASAPVRDDRGRTIRVLAAHISWQWAESMRESVLGPLKERRGVELLIINSEDRIVLAPSGGIPAGSALAEVIRQRPTASGGVVPWSDGADYLTVMTATAPHGQFAGFDWKVVARQPVSAAFAPVAMLQRGYFAGALMLGLFAAAVAWFVTGRLLSPVRKLAHSALALAPASASPHAPGSSRLDEVAQVEKVLHRLASDSRTLSHTALMRELEFVTLAESLPHIVWQADAQGVIEYRNAQWHAALGSTPVARLDQLTTLIHQSDLLTFMDAWSGSRISGADLHCTLRLRSRGDGAYIWFRLHGRALRAENGRMVRWVGTITNVHDAILQAERTEQALELERRARAEAERVALMADEFLATLSHELRTPLNAIAGWSELLARRAGQDDTVARAADVITRNVHLQTALINDLLDTSAIIAGKVALERKSFDAAALVANVALSQKPAAEQKGVTLECRAPAPVMINGDEQRLNQAITNLVANAIKFTDAGGRVCLQAALEGESLLVTVSDSGCGIAPQLLPHAFERFRQEDPSALRRKGGLGLGLAIAASLVKLHGGSIEADSAGLGKGSRFTVRLPALAEASENFVSDGTEQLLQQFPMKRLDGLRILITDDEEDARLATQALLASFGARVTVSASASDTLRLLDSRQFDLLICDIGMPGMDGHDLIRAIRKRSRDKGSLIPAIALTAFAMTRDERAALQAGFDAHVAKPLSAQTLLETICSICEVGSAD
jgi:PAS domain S-box-containing protein